MLFTVLRTLRHYSIRLARWPLVAAALAILTAQSDALHGLTTLLVTYAFCCLAPLTLWWAVRWLTPALSTRVWVKRRDDASEHADGVSTVLDVGQHAGPRSIRRRATTLRPSLARASWWTRRRTRSTAYGVKLVQTGFLPAASSVWSSCEEVTLRIGGPRSGKSGSLACHILDAPGALLVTTSRTDLLDNTRAAREQHGRVVVFNPTGLGGLKSSVRWSALDGCQDLGTAQRRAADLVPVTWGEGERWDNQARGLLAVLMHAAALAGGTMRTVLDWVSPADLIARDQILDALTTSINVRALSAQVRSTYGTNDRTLSSITATLLPRLGWLAETTAAEVGDAPLDHPDFLDVQQLVAEGTDSLYLIGREGACRTLIGALTAEVAHQVRMAAAARPQGRLDPPMTAVLDEAPLTCGPIPLHDWTADMGGRGFTLHIAGQSLAQLRDVWGHDRANTILGNTGSLMVFGGIKNAEDLDRISTLCGPHHKQRDPDDRRPVPVMTPAEIGGLPTGTALVIRTGMRPVIGRAPMAWDRRPVRQRHVATVGAGPIEADSTTPPVARDGRPRLRFIPGGQATGAHDDDDLDADGTDGGRV